MNERRAFLEAAASYLVRHQRKDGKFAYRARPDGGAVRNDYNILRHAGTIYALCSAGPFLSEDVSLTIERALTYLWRWYLVPVPGAELQFAIASGRRGRRGSDTAKIGGMGLSLVALSSVDRSWTGFESSAAKGMIRYASSLIRDDGSMTFKLNFRNGKVDDFVSLYYPGEVALAFLLYGLRQDDSVAVNTCVRILMHLADTRRSLDVVPPDHWALLATARLFSASRSASVPLDEDTKARLYHHGVQVVERILAIADASTGPAGSLVDSGKSCSIATRLEGLTAMRPWLAQMDYPSLDAVDRRILEGVGYLIGSQYKAGDCIGGLPWIPRFHPASLGDSNAPEIRIDTVQHAISAVLGAEAALPDAWTPGP